MQSFVCTQWNRDAVSSPSIPGPLLLWGQSLLLFYELGKQIEQQLWMPGSHQGPTLCKNWPSECWRTGKTLELNPPEHWLPSCIILLFASVSSCPTTCAPFDPDPGVLDQAVSLLYCEAEPGSKHKWLMTAKGVGQDLGFKVKLWDKGSYGHLSKQTLDE